LVELLVPDGLLIGVVSPSVLAGAIVADTVRDARDAIRPAALPVELFGVLGPQRLRAASTMLYTH